MPTPRPKLLVLKCRCGCGQWACFKIRPRFDHNGIPTEDGMYRRTHREAVDSAIRWSANHPVGGQSMTEQNGDQ